MKKQFDHIQSIELQSALINVVNFIDTNYLRTHIFASDFNLDQIKISPAINYGYKTKIQSNKIYQLDSGNHARIEVDHDNKKGQKSIVICLERGQENHAIPAILTGFLTIEQNEFIENILDPDDYLNLEHNEKKLKIFKETNHLFIFNFLNENSLKKLIQIRPLGEHEYACESGESILKNNLPSGVNLHFKNIKQRQVNMVDFPEIEFNLQLSYKNSLSPIYKVYVDYFQDEKAEWLFDPDILEDVINKFVTIYSPVCSNDCDYLSILPSQIKTTDTLKKYLKQEGNLKQFLLEKSSITEFESRLIRLVEDSANDKEGSIVADFVFKWNKSDLTLRKKVKLYGFKVKN